MVQRYAVGPSLEFVVLVAERLAQPPQDEWQPLAPGAAAGAEAAAAAGEGTAGCRFEDELFDFVPLEEWVARERLLGRVDERASAADPWAEATRAIWAKLRDKNTRKRYRHGVWLLGVYRGMRERVIEEVGAQHSAGRKRTIEGTIDFQGAEERSAEMQASLADLRKDFPRGQGTGLRPLGLRPLWLASPLASPGPPSSVARPVRPPHRPSRKQPP